MVLSNAGGAGVLAADACAMQGLDLVEPSEPTRTALRELLPPHASVRNPIDTTAGIDPATFGACLEAVLADDTVHAVLTIATPTAVSNPASAMTDALARARSKGITTPVLTVQLSQPEAIRAVQISSGRPVPSYADPAVAVRALTAAVRYGQWRTRPAGHVPDLPNIRLEQARGLVHQFLTDHLDGGWLSP
jgi:acyl-CoA synthetase (NDP forming)